MLNINRFKETAGVMIYSLGLALISFFIIQSVVQSTPGAYLRFDLFFLLVLSVNLVSSSVIYSFQGITKLGLAVTIGINLIIVLIGLVITKGTI